MDCGTLVLVLGLVVDVAGATLLMIYGPHPQGLFKGGTGVLHQHVATPSAKKALHVARMTHLGLILVLMGFVLPFVGTLVQSLGMQLSPSPISGVSPCVSPAS